MARTAERIQERKNKRTGRWEYPVETVAVTPRTALQLPSSLTARAPLDALVTFCDRHAWHVADFPRTYGADGAAPCAMPGRIFPADHGDPLLNVRVVPVSVRLIADKDGRRYAGTYRIERM